jgi:hypothetical protein
MAALRRPDGRLPLLPGRRAGQSASKITRLARINPAITTTT